MPDEEVKKDIKQLKREYNNDNKRFDKACKSLKKAKARYIKSILKELKYEMHTLLKLHVSDNDDVEFLPMLINSIDDSVFRINDLVKDYRKFI